MEYVYAALLLHKAGKTVDEASVKKVVEAAGVKAEDARLKALVAALQGVNIDEAVKKSAVVAAPVAAAPVTGGPAKPSAEDEKKKEEEAKKKEEEAAAGLGALFG